MKKCPFCKEEINENAAKCPKCNMVLIENIPAEVRKNSPKKEAHKENFFREKTKKILKQTGRIFIKIITRYKPLSIAAFIALFVVSYNYIFVNKYERTVNDITQTIGTHVKSIAIDKGRKTGPNGKIYEEYLYDNKNLNINLFDQKEQELENNYHLFFSNKEKEEVITSFLDKYSTIYLFTLGEILDRASKNGDIDTFKEYSNKFNKLAKDTRFIKYVKDINKENIFEEYKSSLNKLFSKTETRNTVDTLDKEIDECKINCSIERNNELINQYNEAVKEHNQDIDIGKNFFYTTINMIDISLIFPAQDKMELTGNKE